MRENKRIMILFLTAGILLLTAFHLIADQGNNYGRKSNRKFDKKSVTKISRTQIESLIKNIPIKPLDDVERSGILQMREEEKLARDVYNYLYTKWNIPIFSNIARAEETHMNAVGVLIERYHLDDPIKSDIPGKFMNSEIQRLYDELTKAGSKSLVAALKIGATIEDLDIKDLEDLMEKTDNDDIKIVYQNLDKGSRNHLRAFYSQLRRNGEDYKAQYISENYLQKIVNSERERKTIIKDPNFKF